MTYLSIDFSNPRLSQLIRESRGQGKITNELGEALIALTHNLARNKVYREYSYREDMIGHALVILSRTVLSFDPDKFDNPIAYITTCIKGAFVNYLNGENRQRVIKTEAEVLYQCDTSEQ